MDTDALTATTYRTEIATLRQAGYLVISPERAAGVRTAFKEIQPCLFCGKEQDADSFHYNGSGPPPSYAVECGWCGARGSCALGRGRDDHEGAKRAAVRAWNEAQAAALRGALDKGGKV